MPITDKDWWKSLESWSPTAFLAAGFVLLGHATLKGGEVVTGAHVLDVVKVTNGHIGLLLPVFGLLDLYPRLRDGAPRLSVAGAVTSVASGVCSLVLLATLAYLTLAMEGYPAVPEETPLWGSVVLIVSLLTILLGFLFLGVASLRTDAVPRAVSYLLLVPVLMWATLFPMLAMGVDGGIIGVVVYTPVAASLLAIGYRLRTGADPADETEALTDPTV